MTDTLEGLQGRSKLLREVSLNLSEVESTVDKKNQELVAQRYDLMKVINSMITRIRALKRFVRDIKKTPGIYEKTDSTEHAESLDIRLNQINDRLKILITKMNKDDQTVGDATVRIKELLDEIDSLEQSAKYSNTMSLGNDSLGDYATVLDFSLDTTMLATYISEMMHDPDYHARDYEIPTEEEIAKNPKQALIDFTQHRFPDVQVMDGDELLFGYDGDNYAYRMNSDGHLEWVQDIEETYGGKRRRKKNTKKHGGDGRPDGKPRSSSRRSGKFIIPEPLLNKLAEWSNADRAQIKSQINLQDPFLDSFVNKTIKLLLRKKITPEKYTKMEAIVHQGREDFEKRKDVSFNEYWDYLKNHNIMDFMTPEDVSHLKEVTPYYNPKKESPNDDTKATLPDGSKIGSELSIVDPSFKPKPKSEAKPPKIQASSSYNLNTGKYVNIVDKFIGDIRELQQKSERVIQVSDNGRPIIEFNPYINYLNSLMTDTIKLPESIELYKDFIEEAKNEYEDAMEVAKNSKERHEATHTFLKVSEDNLIIILIQEYMSKDYRKLQQRHIQKIDVTKAKEEYSEKEEEFRKIILQTLKILAVENVSFPYIVKMNYRKAQTNGKSLQEDTILRGIMKDMEEARQRAAYEFDARHAPQSKHWYSWLFGEDKPNNFKQLADKYTEIGGKKRRTRKKK